MALLAVNATLETAYGNANKTLFEAQAVKSTIKEVVERQAISFAFMKTNLTFGNPQLMEYMKNNLIKDY